MVNQDSNNGITNVDDAADGGALTNLDAIGDGILGDGFSMDTPDPVKPVEPIKPTEPTLTDAQKAIITANEGSTGFDDKGNLIGQEGRVLKTKEQLDTDTATITTDDDTVLMNETGDIVDKDGKVLIEAKDVQKDKDGNVILPTDDDKTIVSSVGNHLITNYGIPLTKEDLDLPDTEENYAKLAVKAGEYISETKVKEWLDTNPRVLQYYNHLSAGGNDESFFSIGNQWRNTSLPADDVNSDTALAVRRNAIEQNFLHSFGYYKATTDDERAEIKQQAAEQAQLVVDAGKVVESSKAALKSLQRNEKRMEEERTAKDSQILQQREQEREQYWKDVDVMVKSGKAGEFTIPVQDQAGFLEYLSKDVTGKGQSKSMLDDSKLGLDRIMQWEFMKYKGFDLDKLITLRAKTMTVQGLRDRAKGKPVKVVRAAAPTNGKVIHEPMNLSDVSLDNLIN